MGEQFELPIEYKGEQHFFKATLNVYGYTHKFYVDVNGQTILFEQDEEGNYRAVLTYSDIHNDKNIDVELLKKISEVIEEKLLDELITIFKRQMKRQLRDFCCIFLSTKNTANTKTHRGTISLF